MIVAIAQLPIRYHNPLFFGNAIQIYLLYYIIIIYIIILSPKYILALIITVLFDHSLKFVCVCGTESIKITNHY